MTTFWKYEQPKAMFQMTPLLICFCFDLLLHSTYKWKL